LPGETAAQKNGARNRAKLADRKSPHCRAGDRQSVGGFLTQRRKRGEKKRGEKKRGEKKRGEKKRGEKKMEERKMENIAREPCQPEAQSHFKLPCPFCLILPSLIFFSPSFLSP
jgi:hypothetical protein